MSKEDLALKMYKGSILDALQSFAMLVDPDMFLRCLLRQISVLESVIVTNADPEKQSESQGKIDEAIDMLKQTYNDFKRVRDVRNVLSGSSGPEGGASA